MIASGKGDTSSTVASTVNGSAVGVTVSGVLNPSNGEVACGGVI
jgi:hypothetical protein